ncbi:MAG: type II toxin-antitoxin system RelB/DinJ family antitoxin [Microbacteriaceae bacterium]|nr:type II toxin-antitoxin system RelB/DinJ family antitoxin [Microbacteriaceae bacterium]
MPTMNLNIRVDKSLKEDAEYLFNELGFNMTTAVNMFLRSAVRENRIPFELKTRTPNAETIAAIEEGRRIARDPNVKGYRSIEELRADLGV